MPRFYIFFLPGNCLDLSNCPVATSGFQNVTRGWLSNACLFNSRSLLSQAKRQQLQLEFPRQPRGNSQAARCDEVGLNSEDVGASGINVHLAKRIRKGVKLQVYDFNAYFQQEKNKEIT